MENSSGKKGIYRTLSMAVGAIWTGTLNSLPPQLVKAFARILFSRSWKKFKAAAKNPSRAQLERLLWILERNSNTEIGRRYCFGKIDSVRDFQTQVPITTYDDIQPYIKRMINGEQNILTADPVNYFALTSGTSGAAKYIPITRPFLREYQHGRRVWTRQVALAFPGMVKGSVLTIRSTKIDGRTPSGTPFGPISVALGNNDPGAAGPLKKLIAPLETIPLRVFDVDDFDSRYYLLLRIAVTIPVSMIAAINPSTILLLCRKLNEFALDIATDCDRGGIKAGLDVDADLLKSLEYLLGPRPDAAKRINRSMASFGRVRPVDIWPDICGLLCWKAGSSSFYLRQFEHWFGDLPVMDYCYAATEGNFTVAMNFDSDDGVLNAAGHFLEFIPEDSGDEKRPLLGHELEQGRRYRVLLSASNGLYRYDINDIVEVVGFWYGSPRLVFVQKSGNVISYTGEKVTESHVRSAMDVALQKSKLVINAYCFSAKVKDGLPRYFVAIEPGMQVDTKALSVLLKNLDLAMMEANIEYASKRKSQRLAEPEILLVKRGEFEKWILRRISQGASDSRVKLPLLVKDPGEILKMDLVETIGMDGLR